MIETNNLSFHHIGVATNDIHKEMRIYSLLGYVQEGAFFHDLEQQVKGVFMVLGSMRVELLEPDSDKSPLHTVLKNRQKMYHQCLECSNIEGAIETLIKQGAHIVSSPKPAIAFENRLIAFLMLPSMTIIELVEQNATHH
jgi:hypothetical protein